MTQKNIKNLNEKIINDTNETKNTIEHLKNYKMKYINLLINS